MSLHRRAFLATLAALGFAGARPAAARTAQGLMILDSPRPMPALDIRDENSGPVHLEDLRGRAVLLNLWASWCMPCVAELPALDRLIPKAAAMGVAVVPLSLDRGGKIAVVNTYARLGITALPVRTDEARAAAEKLGVTALPVSLLLDAQGREVARYVGAADWNGPQAAAMLEALAAGRPLTPDLAPPPARVTQAP